MFEEMNQCCTFTYKIGMRVYPILILYVLILQMQSEIFPRRSAEEDVNAFPKEHDDVM